MKIYINHSFLFNIDSMLRWFSSEIDHRCGQNVVSTNNCSCCSLYFWFILYIVLVLWESYLTKQLQKKKVAHGVQLSVSLREGREEGWYIYIYRGGGSLQFMKTNNPNKCPKNNNQCFGDDHILFRVERGHSLSARNLGGGY